MLGREIGNRGFADFLRRLPETKYRILALEMAGFSAYCRAFGAIRRFAGRFCGCEHRGGGGAAEHHADTHTGSAGFSRDAPEAHRLF